MVSSSTKVILSVVFTVLIVSGIWISYYSVLTPSTKTTTITIGSSNSTTSQSGGAGPYCPTTNVGIITPNRFGEQTVSLFTATAANIWAKFGLVETTTIAGASAQNIQALETGQYQVADDTASNIFIADAKGLPVSIITGQNALGDGGLRLTVPINSPYNSISDLKGHNIKIFTSTTGSYINQYIQQLIKTAGLNASEVTIVPFSGTTTAEQAALLSGQVDMAWFNAVGADQIVATGQAKVIANRQDVGMYQTNEVLIATNSMIQNNPNLIKRILSAYYEGAALAAANATLGKQVVGNVFQSNNTVLINEIYTEVTQTTPMTTDGRTLIPGIWQSILTNIAMPAYTNASQPYPPLTTMMQYYNEFTPVLPFNCQTGQSG